MDSAAAAPVDITSGISFHPCFKSAARPFPLKAIVCLYQLEKKTVCQLLLRRFFLRAADTSKINNENMQMNGYLRPIFNSISHFPNVSISKGFY